MYCSNSFRLISLLLPHQITYLQFSSLVKSLNLFIPIPKYAEASSSVRLDFSHNGISFFIIQHSFLLRCKYSLTELYSVTSPEAL